MSGIISGMNYSLLFSGTSSASNASAAILSDLYGNGAATSTAVSTGNPLTDLQLAQKNQTTDVALEAKTLQVASDIALFTKAVGNSTSIQNALANPYVQKVLLTANGLSNYIGETALVQKALLSDPTDPNSLGERTRRHHIAEHGPDL